MSSGGRPSINSSMSSSSEESLVCSSLVRKHLGDWITIVLIAVTGALSVLIRPHQQIFSPTDPHLQFPLMESTVPDWAVPMVGFILPLVIFLCLFTFSRSPANVIKEQNVLHGRILGLCMSNALTLTITNFVKVGVGRPRPNFLALTGYVAGTFTSSQAAIDQAFSSFPSGHSSMSFCGLGFLSFVLFNAYHPAFTADGAVPNSTWRTVMCLLPWVLSTWVMCTD